MVTKKGKENEKNEVSVSWRRKRVGGGGRGGGGGGRGRRGVDMVNKMGERRQMTRMKSM